MVTQITVNTISRDKSTSFRGFLNDDREITIIGSIVSGIQNSKLFTVVNVIALGLAIYHCKFASGKNGHTKESFSHSVSHHGKDNF